MIPPIVMLLTLAVTGTFGALAGTMAIALAWDVIDRARARQADRRATL